MTLNLGDYLQIIADTVCINGQKQGVMMDPILLPDMVNVACHKPEDITVTFSATVTGRPNTIRPLIAASVTLDYFEMGSARQVTSDEALVEVSTASIFEYADVCVNLPNKPICSISQINITNINVKPSEIYLNLDYHDISFNVVVTYLNPEGLECIVVVPKTLIFNYAIEENSQVYIWTEQKSVELEQNQIVMDLQVVD